VKHPYHEYATEKALELARMHMHPPGTDVENLPLPSPREALRVLREVRQRQDFNWITGRVAIEVLCAELGEDVKFTP
jgi:hypothetical protein